MKKFFINLNQQSIESSDFSSFYSHQIEQLENIQSKVNEIITKVRKYGDLALLELTNIFDKTNFLSAKEFLTTDQEFLNAEKFLSEDIKKALELAFERIFRYHQRQMPQDFSFFDESGVFLGNCWKPIQSLGVYVPGGNASYPSSVLMSAVPALVAGVDNISICAPSSMGILNPAVLFAAKLCGIKKIYKIGGAQAIAAMTYGTATIEKVHKICGPGNSYVATAKKLLYGEIGIDMIAGPTDLTIIADENSNPKWTAIDAISQLEHGCDSRIFLITDSENFSDKFLEQISEIAPTLPRYEIIASSLKNSAILVVKNLENVARVVDFIAPEHLQIICGNQEKIAKEIQNAGAIFIGKYTPEAIGDYIAGPSHTLPTSGTARFASGLSVYDFLKRISLISCDENSFSKIAKPASILANCEGLHGHKLSIDIRTT